MKKFSKLFLSCAAVAAVTAAVATSAMAAGISATYAPADATHETATLTIYASGYTAAQKTLLVLKPGVTLDKIDVDKGDVLQIDQKDGNDSIAVALPKNLADGKYTVYMGGDGQVYSDTFRVGAGKVLIGDANQDGYVEAADATAILKYNINKYTFKDNGEEAADANQDGYVEAADATAILKYNINKIDKTNDKVGTEK